ncbi:MAG: nitroreductase [Bacteroidota bacterium]|jgi:nitroreductase|nr:nitroreductase [Bacteroidota bacterium]
MESNFNVDQFNSIVQSRRSVFPYQFIPGKAVPDEIIWQILDNANRAPNHKHTEPWRFTVFAGEGLQRFSTLQSEIYTRYAGEKFKEAKIKNLVEYPLMSSHVIAIGMKRNEENKLPESEEIIATACAIENIYLSATAYGLGGYLSTGGITYFEEAKAYFDLGPGDRLLGFFYLGYIATPATSLSKREPVKEKVKWIKN